MAPVIFDDIGFPVPEGDFQEAREMLSGPLVRDCSPISSNNPIALVAPKRCDS